MTSVQGLKAKMGAANDWRCGNGTAKSAGVRRHADPPIATDRPRPITWLRVPAEREVPGEVRELWRKAEEKLGFVPNVMRAFALRPAHLLGWWRYYDDLLRGEATLSRAQWEMIAVVVSSANRCHY